MSQIVGLRPDQVRSYADQIEDDAYRAASGPRRYQLLAFAYSLRKEANLAQWLGIERVRAEIAERSPRPLAW